MEDLEKILLGRVEFNEAKRLQALLGERGVEMMLVAEPETCTTKTCRPVVEVWFLKKDLPVIQEFFREDTLKTFEGLDFKPELLEEVYDISKDTARCPACGMEFSTKLTTCPECGLSFVVE